jgi:N-formylglutamate amidohydrolase
MQSSLVPLFDLHGPATPVHPVILSVPHAGRDYSDQYGLAETKKLIKPSVHRLAILEDRHADLLIGDAVRAGASALVARAPRLIIDLNRSETDLDPGMVDGPIVGDTPLSAKARGGLGLIPRRTSTLGELWTRKLEAAEVHARIETLHRPYHTTLAAMLRGARTQFGAAVLLDIHSMPPLRAEHSQRPTQIVIGDRYGRSAQSRFTEAAADAARALGYVVAVNAPYPGNYILERHGQPPNSVHALQIEIDRSLYLDTWMIEPSRGLAATQRLVQTVVDALAREAGHTSYLIAAE